MTVASTDMISSDVISDEMKSTLLEDTLFSALTKEHRDRILDLIPMGIDLIEIKQEILDTLDEQFTRESEILGESFTKLIMRIGGKAAGLKLMEKLEIPNAWGSCGYDTTTELYDLYILEGEDSPIFQKYLRNSVRRIQRYIQEVSGGDEDYDFLLRSSDTSSDFLHGDLWGAFPTLELEELHNPHARFGDYRKFGIKNIELNILKLLKDFEERKQNPDYEVSADTKLSINIVQEIARRGVTRISAKYEDGKTKIQIVSPMHTWDWGVDPHQYIEIDESGAIQVWQCKRKYKTGEELYDGIQNHELLSTILTDEGLPKIREIQKILDGEDTQKKHELISSILVKKTLLQKSEEKYLQSNPITQECIRSIDDWYYQRPVTQLLEFIESTASHLNSFEAENPYTIGEHRSRTPLSTVLEIQEILSSNSQKLEKGIEMEFMGIPIYQGLYYTYPVQLKPIQDRNFPFTVLGQNHKSNTQKYIGETPFVFGQFEITCRIIRCGKKDFNLIKIGEPLAIEGQSGARFFENDFPDFGLTLAIENGVTLAHDEDYIPMSKSIRREYRFMGVPHLDMGIEWEEKEADMDKGEAPHGISKHYYTFRSDGESGSVWKNN